tara:strand:+ start:89 stop:280 length:192 start_codon:yes stop_codon:yes gene_type:complete
MSGKQDIYWYEGHKDLFWAPCKKVGEEGDKFQVEIIGADEDEDNDEPLYINAADARVVHPSVL